MSGPNREWKHGDRGPDYHSETMATSRHQQWWGRPRASDELRIVSAPPSSGRDPNDHFTRELPGFEQPIPNCIITRVAAGLFEIADDEVIWLVLLLREESEWELAETGDTRKQAALGWVP